MLEGVKRVHMVGIGGVGMSGIAALLDGQGYEVSGSDLVASAAVERLRAAGLPIAVGHDASHLDLPAAPDLVVLSSAVPGDNPELIEARRRGIPVVSRGAMLAELARTKRALAVVGSHGKTTTTSMLGLVLERAGLDPTVVVGGVVRPFGGNVRQGTGEVMVLEADESDRSFLALAPQVAVLTNVDDEHLEAYDGMSGLEEAFGAFVRRVLSGGGKVVWCADDPRLQAILNRYGDARATTGGFGIASETAHVRARAPVYGPEGTRCEVLAGGEAHDLELPVPGRHNLLDALAAVAAAMTMGVAPGDAAATLARFTGVGRRFETFHAPGGVELIDDYGHHPTEIAAVVETARLRNPRRLILVFEPHRYSRTARLLDRFGAALALADHVVLTGLHAASERPIEGVDANAVARAVRRHADIPIAVAADHEDAAARVAAAAGDGDTVVILGAGPIGGLRPRIKAALDRRTR
ncbi:MAG: UDP-N-acetylmuramate--L-alanine ligase [Acidobacteria bacterium]|nr:UDP-N-acetylmuramate--L-alanine ligase [Acidobacteriota bacterium]